VNNEFDLSGRLTVANPGTNKERTYTYDNNDNLTSVIGDVRAEIA
jgi:hypothetical protein